MKEIPVEFVLCLAKLFAPTLKISDGLVFLEETFDLEEYKKHLSEGMESSEAQYWMNLVYVNGVFEDLRYEDAVELAQKICPVWNLNIENNETSGVGKARVLLDSCLEEVCLTIDQYRE